MTQHGRGEECHVELESLAINAVEQAATTVSEAAKEVWSIMDAAVEKPMPSQYLSPKGISAIQGE